MHVRAVAGEPLRIEGRTATGVGREGRVGRLPSRGRTTSRRRPNCSATSSTGWAGRSTTWATCGRRSRGSPWSLGACSTPCGASWSPGSTSRPRCSGPGRSRPTRSSPSLRAPLQRPSPTREPGEPPHLAVLCRTTAQVEAAVASGVATIYADYQDIKVYKEAVAAAQAGLGDDLPGHPSDPEAVRGEHLPLPEQAGGRRPPGPQRGGPPPLRRARRPVRRRFLAQRLQRADGRAGSRSAGRSG